MISLSCDRLSKAFGAVPILESLTFQLRQGTCLGVVGANGTGKTTLLRILTGELPSDSGSVYKTRDLKIGYLQQNPSENSDRTVWEEARTVFEPIRALEAEICALETAIAEAAGASDPNYEGLLESYAQKTDAFAQAEGYAYERRMRGVLTGLGFSQEEYRQPIRQLSGGQKTRVALAKLLLANPDLLLLDEPTNHLDLSAMEWLEDYLKGYTGTLMIISHDRYFLDSLCDAILEIEHRRGRLFQGNYTEYTQKKQAASEIEAKAYDLQQREIERQETIIRRYRAFNREKSIRAAESRQKALDRMDRLEKPQYSEEIRMAFGIERQSGRHVLEAEGLSMAFGDQVLFEDLTFALERGDRVGLLGANGTGKTTLFRLLIGALTQKAGSITFGTGVDIGYYDQDQTSINPAHTVLEELWSAYPPMLETQVRSALALFLFKGEDVSKTVAALSGGERGRLMLCKLMLARKNLLLLDEPTNHLDMDSKEVLEAALADYPGTLLVISHDRYFLNKIVNRIFLLESGQIQAYLGNYHDYLEKRMRDSARNEPEAVPGVTKTAQKEARRKEREERRQRREAAEAVAAAETEVQRLEEKVAHLEASLCDPALYGDAEKMLSVRQTYDQEKAALEAAYDAWAALLEDS